MKRRLLFLLFFLIFLNTSGQKSADVGVRLGAAVYWGDIENVDYGRSVSALYGVLGRWNFNNRLAIRGQLITGELKAYGEFPNAFLADQGSRVDLVPHYTGSVDPNNLYPYLYPRQMSDDFYFIREIQTFEAIMEFNFRAYRMGNMKKERYTPFVSLGVGGFYSREPIRTGTLIIEPTIVGALSPDIPLYSPSILIANDPTTADDNQTNNRDALTPIIPIGFGIKYNLTKRIGLCAELSVRKTFTDNIDNLVDPKRFQDVDQLTFPNSPGYEPEFAPGVLFNNDWYASLHLSLHYQVWSDRGICKVIEKNKKMMNNGNK